MSNVLASRSARALGRLIRSSPLIACPPRTISVWALRKRETPSVVAEELQQVVSRVRARDKAGAAPTDLREAVRAYVRLIEALDPPPVDPDQSEPAVTPLSEDELRVLKRSVDRLFVQLRRNSADRPQDYVMAMRIFEDRIRVFKWMPNVDEVKDLLSGMAAAQLTRTDLLPLLQRLVPIYRLPEEAARDPQLWAAVFAAIARDKPGLQILESVDTLCPTLYDEEFMFTRARAFASHGHGQHLQQLIMTSETTDRDKLGMRLKELLNIPRHQIRRDAVELAVKRLQESLAKDDRNAPSMVWQGLTDAYTFLHDQPVALHASTSSQKTLVANRTTTLTQATQASEAEAYGLTVTELVKSDTRLLSSVEGALHLLEGAAQAAQTNFGSEAVAVCLDRLAVNIPLDPELETSTAIDSHPAMQLYKTLVHGPTAITPTSTMVEPILRYLVLPPIDQQPSDFEIRVTQMLYLDLTTAHENGLGPPPTAGLYELLLHTTAQTSSRLGYTWALQLIGDMTTYCRTLPVKRMAELAGGAMKLATSGEQAFKVWQAVVKLYDDGRLMTRKGFDRLLDAYLRAPATTREFADKTTMYTILRTMRELKEWPGHETYSLFFKHFGRLDKEHLRSIGMKTKTGSIPVAGSPQTLDFLHAVLKIDPYFDPDTSLLNELIQAYSHAGQPEKGLRIWSSMLHVPQRADWNHRTITSLLDLCSHARNTGVTAIWTLARLREAREQHRAGGFALDKHAWDTWVECLSRLGHNDNMDRVLDVVFAQMTGRNTLASAPPIEDELGPRSIEGRGAPGFVSPPQPDEKTLEPLLKFAHARGGRKMFEHVQQRIQDELPHLWQKVENIGRLSGEDLREERWRSRWNLEIDGDEPWLTT